MVIFNELYLCGYNIGVEGIKQLAEESNGSSFQIISQLAKEYKVGIVYGYAERQDSFFFNSVQVVDINGLSLINYRKTHLYYNPSFNFEREAFSKGNQLMEPFSFKGLKMGILICWDIEFPEPARVLKLLGAEVIIVPTANNDPLANHITSRSRAYENQVFVCYINRIGIENGKEFNGESVIFGPDGQYIARSPPSNQNQEELFLNCFTVDNEFILVADIDMNCEGNKKTKEYNPFFEEDGRRPPLYSKVVQSAK
eukprot:TRINITY_DN2138_c0_g1_i2.p1 TRINITY_DN2138_c0_g1~~TRINITY_DN2138_c0_g1_i2.p1  ORF type:complete len:255 (+),score=79.70 TRINITY_DN2138_c0_g1_i2:177-941(+)